MSFNARGLVATAAQPRFDTDPQYWTTFTYDPRNRVAEKKLPDLNTVTYGYGLDYTLTTNPEGDLISNSHSPNGLITYLGEYWNGVPVVTTTITDPDARTQHVYDHVNNHWVTVFDSLGRPVTLTDPDSGTETREYDDSGLLKATVNALNERTELTYDDLGRPLTKTTRAGTPEAEVTTFTYDQDRVGYFNKGFLTRMDDTAGFEEMDYDVLGRPAKTKRNLDAQDYVFERFYNAAGLPSSVVYPDTDVVSWTYDAAGGLETETGTITASTYDAAGRLVSRGFTNGVATDVAYSQTRGWVENIHTFKNGTTHQNLTYAYYADGMIQSVTSPKGKESWTYQYDDLNRLEVAVNVDTPSLSQSFTYDEIGNILTNSQIGTYGYPNPGAPRPHAVTSAGSRSYVFNDAGQMTSRNGTVLQWNGDGKPSSIGNVGFVYDGVGNRLKKLSGGQQTRYIGGDYEIENNGTITKYLAGGKKRGATFFIHHKDHLGSIQVVTNQSGWQVRRQKHKPFGDQHEVDGWHTESKGWIGEREEETELVYLNARYYDPEIGRFTAPDPVVRIGQGLNRFSYARNNPVNLRDPSGLDPDPVCGSMSAEECIDYLKNLPTDPTNFNANCEVNASCRNHQGDDLGLQDFQSESEEMLARVLERHALRAEQTGVDCTQEGVDCGPPPCADFNSCRDDTTTSTNTDSVQTGPQPDNPLYNCQNGLKTNCRGNRGGDAAAAAATAEPQVESGPGAGKDWGMVGLGSFGASGFAGLLLQREGPLALDHIHHEAILLGGVDANPTPAGRSRPPFDRDPPSS